jgi:hypothetical protein
MRRRARVVAPACALAALGALAAPLAGQSWRTLDVSRQLHDTADYRVQVKYAAGALDLRGLASPLLYSMRLRYDEARSDPVHRLDTGARTLTLGLDNTGFRFGPRSDEQEGELQLGLSTAVPMRLGLEIAAVHGRADLTGLVLRSLRVDASASEATILFDRPNPSPMERLTISVAAASVRAVRLANANAREITVNGNLGGVDLDLGGDWAQDLAVDASLGLGELTIRVPRDIGLRVEVQKFLASFDHEGLIPRDGAWVSDNWESAPRHLRVRAQTTIGGLRIERY